MDITELYRQMCRARAFESAVAGLWERGLISGELHLGTGEEAVAAGVVTHLRDGDGLALDHRSTPPLVVRGVDPVLLIREMLGREDGLCRGQGGHMHLFSQAHCAASSGIVGASAPMGAGFALSARLLGNGSAAVAFFGEGAMNQGMLLETLNLAVAWRLPLLLVCKDNGWAITTESQTVTGGDIVERARSFGFRAQIVDGLDVRAVWLAAGSAVERARSGDGPSFILAQCTRLDGHLMGDPMLRIARKPITKGIGQLSSITHAAMKPRGGSIWDRISAMTHMTGLLRKVSRDRRDGDRDPLVRTFQTLAGDGLEDVARKIEEEARAEIDAAVRTAMDGEGA